MGEYAEMMLDGTCCAQCGEFLDSGGDGFPVVCAACTDAERGLSRAERGKPPMIAPDPNSNRSKKRRARSQKRTRLTAEEKK